MKEQSLMERMLEKRGYNNKIKNKTTKHNKTKPYGN
jgi:hypothetical protein